MISYLGHPQISKSKVAAAKAAQQQNLANGLIAGEYKPGKYGQMALNMISEMQSEHDNAIFYRSVALAREGKRLDGTSLYGPWRDGYITAPPAHSEGVADAIYSAASVQTALDSSVKSTEFVARIIGGIPDRTTLSLKGNVYRMPSIPTLFEMPTISSSYDATLKNVPRVTFDFTEVSGIVTGAKKVTSTLETVGKRVIQPISFSLATASIMSDSHAYYETGNTKYQARAINTALWAGADAAVGTAMLALGPIGWIGGAAYFTYRAYDSFSNDGLDDASQRLINEVIDMEPKNKFSKEDLRLREEVEAKYDFMGFK
ncbi:hypothetical protein ACJJIK_03645 [Microbulbifer sp. ZKSA006]|uniref:hypothetical protein n=1 Tax=Microbulbifer sp. ZKSA006 TaxID=3243390 RepID=UPI0040395DA9